MIDLWLTIAHHVVVFLLAAILAMQFAMIQPGILAFMTGWVGRTVPTPRRG